MRILVTGASGFVGKPLVERCLQDGHDVVALGRHTINASSVTSVVADLTDRKALEAVKAEVGAIDAIVHMAALVPRKPDEDLAENMAHVNVQGTINLLETFAKDVQVVVNGSTAEVYGLPDVDGPITEKQLPSPPSNYGTSKLSAEHFANVFAARNSVPVVHLRFSVMYGGPDPIARAIPNFIKKAIAGEPLQVFGGEDLRDYLHVEDAVESIMCSLKAKNSGVYNVGAGTSTSIKQTAESIIAAVGSKSTLTILPPQKKPANLVFDSSAIMKDLGYKPKYAFPQGLEAQIAWQREQQ